MAGLDVRCLFSTDARSTAQGVGCFGSVAVHFSYSAHLGRMQDIINFAIYDLLMELRNFSGMLLEAGFQGIFALLAVIACFGSVANLQFDCTSGNGFKRCVRAAV